MTFYVSEYIKLQRMKEIGITSDLKEYDDTIIDIFNYISVTFDKIQDERRKKNAKRR